MKLQSLPYPQAIIQSQLKPSTHLQPSQAVSFHPTIQTKPHNPLLPIQNLLQPYAKPFEPFKHLKPVKTAKLNQNFPKFLKNFLNSLLYVNMVSYIILNNLNYLVRIYSDRRKRWIKLRW